MAAKSGFTRIPKVQQLMLAGVPVEAIPTYCALADHANNKNGLCWPKMATLERALATPSMARRKRASTTGHERRLGTAPPIFTRTKGSRTPPSNPPTEGYEWLFGLKPSADAENTAEEKNRMSSEASRRRSEGYEWLFE